MITIATIFIVPPIIVAIIGAGVITRSILCTPKDPIIEWSQKLDSYVQNHRATILAHFDYPDQQPSKWISQ